MADVLLGIACLFVFGLIVWAVTHKPEDIAPPEPIDIEEAWRRKQRRRAGR